MNDDGLDPPQPLSDAKNAAEDFVVRLTNKDRSGLVSFATRAEILQSLSSDHTATQKAVATL